MTEAMYIPYILPSWYDGKHINEVKFCSEFLAYRDLKFIDNTFYSINGVVPLQKIEKDITDLLICAEITRGIGSKVTTLVNALKRIAYTDDLEISQDEIHVANGVLNLDGTFSEYKMFCKNRLTVNYNPNADEPIVWLKFLLELLEPDDIKTLQEFMGYCLINSTKAQAMLFIIGNGGEGKSRIGVVMYDIFKDSAYFGSINELAADKFLKSNLVGKSLLIDDDMNLNGLKDTSFLKSLATAETPIAVQAKRVQGIQTKLSVRSICFSNGSLSAIHDKSDGWSRRLLILSTKPISPNRITDHHLSEKLFAEKEGIFLWMLKGLQRLTANDFEFTRSDKLERNLAEMKEDNCNIIGFLKDEQFIAFDINSEVSTVRIYKNYCDWCDMNGLIKLKQDTFSGWLKQNHLKYNMAYSNYVFDGQDKKSRGYRGIKILK